jgi:hypothetical protein
MTWTTLLDGLAAHDAEGAAGRANLCGAGLLALRELGAGDELLRTRARAWAQGLPPAPPAQAWPVGDAWAGRFGQRAAWPAYRALFGEWLLREGGPLVLAQALPQLWPGAGAAGLQAVVRTAAAVRTGHRGEVADALAHWACRWMPLPGPDAASGPAAEPGARRRAPAATDDPVAVLRTLRAVDAPARRLDARLQAAAREGHVARALARLVIDERTPARLSAAAAAACAGSGDPVARLLVCATHGVRVLAKFVDEPQPAWQAWAGVFAHAAVAARWQPRPAAPLRPWSELVAAARACDDALTVACVESCRAEEQAHAQPGQTLWRAAAAQALAVAASPARPRR